MKNVYPEAYNIGKKFLKIQEQNKYFGIHNPSVMFDIDGTLIDYQGYPIKHIIKLLNLCIKNNLNVIIITARPISSTQFTESQLRYFNIDYSVIFYRTTGNNFKSNIKKGLSELDLNIILSIGDNIVDVEGEYSGFYIKLPNKDDPNLYSDLI